jgi:proteasome accessory factor A
VAITKVCGIETEYGVHVDTGGDMSPTTASSLLINAYVARLDRKVGWDFEDESPGRDARGYAREGSMPPEIETHLVNAVLTNGARYYSGVLEPSRGCRPRPGRRAGAYALYGSREPSPASR